MRSPLTRPLPRQSAPGPSRTPPCGLHGQARCGSATARNGPAPVAAPPAAETPVATGNPSSATPDPRSLVDALEVAHQVHAEIAPGRHRRSPPSWPRNRVGRPPRRSGRNRHRSAPTASGRKTRDPASAASPTSSPSLAPPDDPSAVPSPLPNPPSGQDIRESDHDRLRTGTRLRQRAVRGISSTHGVAASRLP